MKSRRLKTAIGLVLTITVVSMSFMLGCKTDTTVTTSTTPPTEITDTTTPPTSPEVKTLDVGVLFNLGWTLGIDCKKSFELTAELLNQSGGLTIGGEKYNVNFIIYDNGATDTSAKAAANRLIYEDKVKFIITDGTYDLTWLATADAEKVITLTSSFNPVVLIPDYHYVFRGAPIACLATVMPAWMADKYPEKTTWAFATWDDQQGHQMADFLEKVVTASGVDLHIEYFSPSTTDYSAMATKINELNPDVFCGTSDPATEALVYKAVYQAGYRGQIFSFTGASTMIMSFIAPAEALEGMIKAADPVHLDQPPTQLGQEFKDAWIAKYGKWEDPSLIYLINWCCLKAALEEAGSLDVDEVADVIAGGLEFEGPSGSYRMIDRPDMGNMRSVDCVEDCYVVQIVDGKPVLIEHMSLEDSYALYHTYNS